MSRSAQTLILMFVTLFACQSQADDLFSEVSISSVFSKTTADDDNLDRQRTGRRLTGGHSARRMLAEAGFVPTDLDDGYMGIDVELPGKKGSKVLVAVNVSNDRQSIYLAASIVKVQADKASSAELQKLLRSRADTSKPYYEYSTKWLRARWQLDNQHVSASWLKTKIDELIEVVDADRATWQSLGKSFDSVLAANRQSETLAKFDFDGTWTAQVAGSRYGFKFDGTNFRLGIVTNGSFTKSQGTWKVIDGKLQFVGSGLVLDATVEIVSKDEVSLQFGSQPLLKFVRK